MMVERDGPMPSAETRAALDALARVWGPSEAPGRTHVAWRRVGIDEARGLCSAFEHASPHERDMLRELARGWDAHLQGFIHAKCEEAVRTASEAPLESAVLALGLLHGSADPRDLILLLTPFRRACRLVRVAPRSLVLRLEAVIGDEAAAMLRAAAPSGMTRFGLRFSGWREFGPPEDHVFATVDRLPSDPAKRRAAIERFVGTAEGEFADSIRWAWTDPGPAPAKLPAAGATEPDDEARGA